jgi:methylenetetrahydrofolate--tRNA-(uracil-5-)-methyltransferase
MNYKGIRVIGAGLAGCEAAYIAANMGVKVTLYEMKPKKMSPAHHRNGFAELVCSNSLRSDQITVGVGLLKEELRLMGSLIMEAADNTRVPAGSALAVNRDDFSDYITEKIKSHPNITVFNEEVCDIDPDIITVIATGPLTSDKMSKVVSSLTGDDGLHFFDAAAPIIDFSSVNMEKAFFASRYGKGDPTDYLNCPMSKDEYDIFYRAHAIYLREIHRSSFLHNNVHYPFHLYYVTFLQNLQNLLDYE